MSTICRLKERQEAKTTLVFQVCMSETCCQNRNREVGRETWFGGRVEIRSAGSWRQRNPNQGRGALRQEELQEASETMQRKKIGRSELRPSACCPQTSLAETRLIFSSSTLAPCWLHSKGLSACLPGSHESLSFSHWIGSCRQTAGPALVGASLSPGGAPFSPAQKVGLLISTFSPTLHSLPLAFSPLPFRGNQEHRTDFLETSLLPLPECSGFPRLYWQEGCLSPRLWFSDAPWGQASGEYILVDRLRA